jgi:cyclopropane fatty-acyl-phospholipid synthase-like methyltransferase
MQKTTSSPSKNRLSNLYSPHFLRLIQIIYGSDTIISQGDTESIDEMFSGISLEGKKILDVGCGFGGMDFYLAQNHSVNILGVDKEPYMISKAKELKANQDIGFKGKVSFQTQSAPISLQEFSDNIFDIVCSKEMLYHVPVSQKHDYILEMVRVLKPGGMLVIADWICATIPGERLRNAVRLEGFCHFISPEGMQMIMKKSGLSSISFRDVTKDHIKYSRSDIERIKKSKNQIAQELGINSYDSAFLSWNLWLEAMTDPADLMAGIFIGSKSLFKICDQDALLL